MDGSVPDDTGEIAPLSDADIRALAAMLEALYTEVSDHAGRKEASYLSAVIELDRFDERWRKAETPCAQIAALSLVARRLEHVSKAVRRGPAPVARGRGNPGAAGRDNAWGAVLRELRRERPGTAFKALAARLARALDPDGKDPGLARRIKDGVRRAGFDDLIGVSPQSNE